jgi:hypothetical protein
MTDLEQLEAVTGGPHEPVRIAGRLVVITPMTVREIPAAARLFQPIREPLRRLLEGRDADNVLYELFAAGDHVIDGAAALSGVDADWVRGLALAEFWELLAACVRANPDFFALLSARAPGPTGGASGPQ